MHYTWKTRFGVTVACVGGFWVLAQVTAQADANDATQPLSAVTSVVSGSSSEGTPAASKDSQKGAGAETDADGGDGTVTQTNNADDTGGDAHNKGINVGVQGLQCIGVKVSCDNDNTTGQAAIGGNGYVHQSNTNTGQTGGNAQATSGSGASRTDADGGDGTVTQSNNADDTGGDASNKGINVGVQGLQCIGVKVSCDNDNTTGQAAKGGNGYVHQSNTNTGQTGGNAQATSGSGASRTDADGGDGTVTQSNNADDTGGDASNKGINVGVQGLQCIGVKVSCDNDNTTGQAAKGGNGYVSQSNTNTGQTGGDATTSGKSSYPDKGKDKDKAHKPDTKGNYGKGGYGKGGYGKGYGSKGGHGTDADGGDGTVTQSNNAEDTGGDASNKGINVGVQGLQCIGVKVSCDNDNTTGQAAKGGNGYVHQSNTNTGQTGGNATTTGKSSYPDKGKDKAHKPDTKGSNTKGSHDKGGHDKGYGSKGGYGTAADGGDGTVTQSNNAEDTGGDAHNKGINVGAQGLQCIGLFVHCDNDNTTGQAAKGGNGYVHQSNTNTGQTGGNATTSGKSSYPDKGKDKDKAHKPDAKGNYGKGGYDKGYGSKGGHGTDADGGDGTVTQTNNADDTGGDAHNKGINVGAQGLQCIGLFVHCDNDNSTGQIAKGGNGYVHQSNTNTGQTGGNATAKGADVNPVWTPKYGDKGPRHPKPGYGGKCDQHPEKGYAMKGGKGWKGTCAPRPVKRPDSWKHAPVPA